MPNTTLVFSIALNGYDHLFASCINTHREYCKKLGYEYVLVNEAPRRLKATEAAWLKVALLQSALEAGYEWVAFIDADCDIRSHTPPFDESFAGLPQENSVFMAHGFSGRINSGVIFVRNTQYAKDFLGTVLDNADQDIPHEDKAPYENGHMIYYGKNCTSVKVIDYSKWNNNRELDGNSYIQHYSGGILRKWYLENRAPEPYRQTASRTKGKILKRLTRMLNRLVQRLSRIYHWKKAPNPSQVQVRKKAPKPTQVQISSSIQELLPFFEHQYSAFEKSRVAATGQAGAD